MQDEAITFRLCMMLRSFRVLRHDMVLSDVRGDGEWEVRLQHLRWACQPGARGVLRADTPLDCDCYDSRGDVESI